MQPDRRDLLDPPGHGPTTLPGTADVATVLEAYVERVARLVLHAGALADRLERSGDDQPAPVRLSALRDAVEKGERAIIGAVRQHGGPDEPERRSGHERRVVVRA